MPGNRRLMYQREASFLDNSASTAAIPSELYDEKTLFARKLRELELLHDWAIGRM